MSMRNRPSILDHINPDLDPGNLCLPMRQPKAEPTCHCSPPVVGRLGGMSPVIDRDNATCFSLSRLVLRSVLETKH